MRNTRREKNKTWAGWGGGGTRQATKGTGTNETDSSILVFKGTVYKPYL